MNLGPAVRYPVVLNLSLAAEAGPLFGYRGAVGVPAEQYFIATLLYLLLEGMALYAGQLLAPAEGFGRGFFLPYYTIHDHYDALALLHFI